MPLIHERTFRMRYYECDGYGHVNSANYLRYMQETAFDASAAAGYDHARYDEIGCYWLVRETDIEYLHPLRYGDSVRVKTWVVDFRRVRSRRAYEFWQVGGDELVARAHTDWVLLDAVSGRPTPIPTNMMGAFFPEGVPDEAPPRERFPQPPPPPEVFKTRRQVEWRDVDPMQHVSNATYLAYLDDCGIQVAAAYGWPMSRLQTEGFAIVARRHRIEYRKPAALNDDLELATWISGVRHASVFRHYTIRNGSDGTLLARAHTLWAWVDIVTGKPTPIPPDFLSDFAPNIAERPSSD